ncbi:MAG: AI-2E family transporter [Gammaproteobacteria bacterium]|nr:MAG: AI-2E family transporter [Gammaproteobacteria bacterium]
MNSSTRVLLTLAAVVVIAFGLKAAEGVVVSFLLAAFIAIIAAPPIFWLEQRRVPDALAITGVMIAIVGILVTVGALLVQSGTAFTDRLPFYQERVTNLVTRMIAWLTDLGVEINSDVALNLFNPGMALDLAGNLLRGLGSVMSNSFFILLTVIFILGEASSFPRKLRSVLSDPDSEMPLFSKFADNLNRYIAIKTSTSLATGLLVTLSLWLIEVDFPVLWGLLAFLLNFVPNIGSIIAAVPAVLLALIQLGPAAAAGATAAYLAINIIMGNVVEPRFMGRGLGLSTLVVFLSLVVWGALLGPVGMFLSVPLTMTAKLALEANPATAWIAVLLSPADSPDVTPADEAGDGETVVDEAGHQT